MVSKVLCLLLIACVFGSVVRTTIAESEDVSKSSNSTEVSKSSNSTEVSKSSSSTEVTKSSGSSDSTETTKPPKASDSTEATKPPKKSDSSEESKPSKKSDSSEESKPSKKSNSSEESKPSKNSDSSEESEPTNKPEVVTAVTKNHKTTPKPHSRAEEAEIRKVVAKLEIVLPSVSNFTPGLKKNVDRAKELVARNLESGRDFVGAIAEAIRAAVAAARPIVASTNLIATIIQSFSEVASLTPARLGILILQEGLKVGLSILSVMFPLLIIGSIAG